jgi:hypothetical protein
MWKEWPQPLPYESGPMGVRGRRKTLPQSTNSTRRPSSSSHTRIPLPTFIVLQSSRVVSQ